MQRKLSVADVLELRGICRIGGDLILLPRPRLPNLSEGFALQKGGQIDLNTSELARNQLRWMELSNARRYDEESGADGYEPAWMKELPLHSQAFIRYNWAVTQLDPLAIVNIMPNTGLCYMVEDDGLCADAERVLGLGRLQGINQLGFLQAPWVAMSDMMFMSPLTHTTRWLHSLDVMCVGSLIGHNLGLEGGEFSTLRTALISHDRGTPAGGDSVKLVDLPAFDEDANYQRLLNERTSRKAWHKFMGRWGVSEQLLVRTILNQGLLGQVLDVADKLSYVARDMQSCLDVFYAEKDEDVYVGMKSLEELVKYRPYMCGVWDAVRREGDQLVFADAGRLIDFLKARIVLFRELYYHPRARFGEYLMSRVLVKHLYEQGALTRDQLLEMSDHQLETRLGGRFGKQSVIRALSLKSQVRSFGTQAEAQAFVRELEGEGNTFSLMEDHLHAIKPGTHFWVDCPGGPKPLADAYPGDARELWEMANMLPAVHVYYLNKGDDPVDDIGTILEHIRQTAHTLR